MRRGVVFDGCEVWDSSASASISAYERYHSTAARKASSRLKKLLAAN
jgi:hypothetical protein